MPTFGICTDLSSGSAARAAGWDFIEVNAQALLQPLQPDWSIPDAAKTPPLPIRSASALFPGTLKLTGPERDLPKLEAHMRTLIDRAARLGIRTLILGGGAARRVPDGFDRELASAQFLEFTRLIAPLAGAAGIVILLEHLNHNETNFINSLDEAVAVVRQCDHPAWQTMVDCYHFWVQGELLASLRSAFHFLRYVHVSDVAGHVAPGESGQSDFRPIFNVLKSMGYDGPICVEALNFDVGQKDARGGAGGRVLQFLKQQWAEA